MTNKKNQNIKYHLIAFFFLLFLSLIAIRKFLNIDIAIGHNWDSPFSALEVSYRSLLKRLPYVWNDYGALGSSSLPSFSTKIWWLFNAINGILFKGQLITQFRIILAMVIGGFGVYYYVLTLLSKSSEEKNNFFPALCAGLLFSLSPVILGNFIGGAFNQTDSLILIPFLLTVLHRGIYAPTKTKIFLLSFLLLLISTSLHNLIFSILFILIYVFAFYRLSLKKRFFFLTKLFTLTLCLCFYWILPLIYSLFQTNVGQRLQENLDLGNLINNVPPVLDAIFANGYVRPFFNYLIADGLFLVWKIFALILTILVFFSLFFVCLKSIPKLRKLIFIWLGIYLVFITFATGFRGPLAFLVKFLFENFKIMAIFRSPQWLMMPLTLSFSILLGISIYSLLLKLNRKYHIYFKLILISLIFFVFHPTFIYGDLGTDKLYKRALANNSWYKADHLDGYRVPEDYKKAIEYLYFLPGDTRVFLLPFSASPYFKETRYQRQGAGVDPILGYFPPKSLLFNDLFSEYRGKYLLNLAEKKLYVDRDPSFLEFAKIFNAEYLLLKKDYNPAFSNYREFWDTNEIYYLIKNNMSVIGEKIIDGESTLLVKLRENFFWPRFYLSQQIVSVYYNADEKLVGGYIEKDSRTADFITDILLNAAKKSLSSVYLKNSQDFLKTSGEAKMVNEEPKDPAQEILIRAQIDNISEEELGTFHPQDYIELPFVSSKPGTILYNLVLQKEKLEVSREKQSYGIVEKRLLLANKRISELLKYGKDDLNVVDFFLKAYPEEMKVALFEMEKMKKDNDPDFLKAFAQIRSTFEWQTGQIRRANISGSALISLDEVFGNINRTLNGFTVEHESKEFTYNLNIPREGEYEIYIKDINRLTDAKINGLDISENTNPSTISGQVIQYPVSEISEFPGWKLLETQHFSQGEQKYILPNEFFDKNLISDNLKINSYSPDTVYKISFKYKALRDDSGKQPYFSVNESKAGNLFDKTLLYTGNEFENFEMFFRSSGEADRAFVLISVPEYEDLKVEKIAQPEIILKSIKEINEINGLTDYKKIVPKITFVKMNPTKYRVKVEGAKEPYTLVFSESFHQGWKAYISDQRSVTSDQYGEIVASYFNGQVNEGTHRMTFLEPATFETWGKKPIDEERHLLVNGYANSWYITPEDTGGKQDYELIIEFAPQRLFCLGLFISCLSLFSCLGYLGYDYIKRRKVLT